MLVIKAMNKAISAFRNARVVQKARQYVAMMYLLVLLWLNVSSCVMGLRMFGFLTPRNATPRTAELRSLHTSSGCSHVVTFSDIKKWATDGSVDVTRPFMFTCSGSRATADFYGHAGISGGIKQVRRDASDFCYPAHACQFQKTAGDIDDILSTLEAGSNKGHYIDQKAANVVLNDVVDAVQNEKDNQLTCTGVANSSGFKCVDYKVTGKKTGATATLRVVVKVAEEVAEVMGMSTSKPTKRILQSQTTWRENVKLHATEFHADKLTVSLKKSEKKVSFPFNLGKEWKSLNQFDNDQSTVGTLVNAVAVDFAPVGRETPLMFLGSLQKSVQNIRTMFEQMTSDSTRLFKTSKSPFKFEDGSLEKIREISAKLSSLAEGKTEDKGKIVTAVRDLGRAFTGLQAQVVSKKVETEKKLKKPLKSRNAVLKKRLEKLTGLLGSVEALINAAAALKSTYTVETIPLEIERDADIPTIYADREFLKQKFLSHFCLGVRGDTPAQEVAEFYVTFFVPKEEVSLKAYVTLDGRGLKCPQKKVNEEFLLQA